MATAYALKEPDGTINIKTVSDTQRGVMVNALVAIKDERITAVWSDMVIEQTFLSYDDIGEIIHVNVIEVLGRTA